MVVKVGSAKSLLTGRRTTKAALWYSSKCMPLQRSARHFVFANAFLFYAYVFLVQYEGMPPNMKSNSMLIPILNKVYNDNLEIFKIIEAMWEKEKKATTKL